jgi:protein ImuB
MSKRFISIWFRHLKTDWFIRRNPSLKEIPFVLASPDHGRIVVRAVNGLAQTQGIETGMAVADARAILPALEVMDDKPTLAESLLKNIGEWCIRFTPVVGMDAPDGLLLDVTGCAHLWGGEKLYLAEIRKRLTAFGYDVRVAMADTIGAAWAHARFGKGAAIIEKGKHSSALLPLPVAAIRIQPEVMQRLEKLGLRQINSFINMPRPSLRRRFGEELLQRLDEALGTRIEEVIPLHPIELYNERLPCLEPIVTATGIEIALKRLLEAMCKRLQKEEKGLRVALFKCYRVDGKIEQLMIGTNRPSANAVHLFKLFEVKIETIEPALGIELFILEAPQVEDMLILQDRLWQDKAGLADTELAELLDRIEGKIGPGHIQRFVPAEHYWPERSFTLASSIDETIQSSWKLDRPRPLQMLSKPELIEVTAPIPDYPPMLFRYKGKLHKIAKADGPERIEQEWWLQQGQHRDYYAVEDEEGQRYWLFRLGHYDVAKTYQWFLHGFFA